MAENDVDALGPTPDTDGSATTWHMLDHYGSSYGWVKSPGFTAGKAKGIRGAAKIQNRGQWDTAVEAAVGSTWWGARSSTWKDRAYAGCVADAAAFP